MQRRWLDWNQPLLPAAARWLVQRHAAGGRCDLRAVKCVLPGGRAGRLLLRTLIGHCNEVKVRLIPPQVMTPGSMVDVVMPPTATTASDLECSLAWMHVLREADARLIHPLIPRQPDYHDLPAWHELALQIGKIREELSGELLSFGEVARAAMRLQLDREADRWQVLATLYGRYRDRLRSVGRVDPHERRAQALAELELGDDDELVLIGCVDLNQLQRNVVGAFGERAHALIHAPVDGVGEFAGPSLSEGFDEYGCVDPSYWEGRRISIADDRIIICDRPADQAQAVVEQIADFAGAFPPEEITIGLGDESLGEPMAQAGEWADLVVHDPRGKPVLRSRPYRLLSAGIEWLREPRFSNFAALVRHPDVEAWVERFVKEARAQAAADAAAASVGDDSGTAANDEPPPAIDLWPEGQGPESHAGDEAANAEVEAEAGPPAIDLWPEGQGPSEADAAGVEAADAPSAAVAEAATLIDAEPPLAAAAPSSESAGAPSGGDAQEQAQEQAPADEGRIEWLTLLDKYYAEHLSDAASGPWLGDAKTRRRLQLLYEAVHSLFVPLAGGRRPLTEWFEPILEVLRAAYGTIETNTQRLSEARAAAACLEIAR
ncbi:MAG: glycosyltransferase, partial [Myxococcales bacterium]|nr:glycosyltransferase [Myxococcales bacterium]